MKATSIAIATCLVLSLASCNRQSSNPKKDIVGTWKSTDKKQTLFRLQPDGTCLVGLDYLPGSQFDRGTWTLATDPSGRNILTLNVQRSGIREEWSTTNYEAAVYADELILGTGPAEIRFVRRPKETAP